jgi:hypothetical protein
MGRITGGDAANGNLARATEHVVVADADDGSGS